MHGDLGANRVDSPSDAAVETDQVCGRDIGRRTELVEPAATAESRADALDVHGLDGLVESGQVERVDQPVTDRDTEGIATLRPVECHAQDVPVAGKEHGRLARVRDGPNGASGS